MRAAFGLAGLLIVLLIGYMIYASQVQGIGDGKPLRQQTDTVAVKGDLLSIANAEKLYSAANGSYATLERLQNSRVMNPIPAGRAGYQYDIEIDGADHFKITASPADPSQTDLPTFSIDETMQLLQE